MAQRKKRGKEKIRPKSPPQPVGFETVLGPGASITGHLSSKSSVRLDGSFEGTLDVGGNILVGEAGKIIADLNAKYIAIAGAVRGNVTGERVRILRTGRVWGDIRAYSISAEEGAFIQGQMTTVPEGEPLEPPAPKVPEAEVATPEPIKGEERVYLPESQTEEVGEAPQELVQEDTHIYFPEPQPGGATEQEPVQDEAHSYLQEAAAEFSQPQEPAYETVNGVESTSDESFGSEYVDEDGEGYSEAGGELTQPEPLSDADDETAPDGDEESPIP